MDRYSKLSRALLTSKITASNVGDMFHDYWINPLEVPTYLFTDNGQKFVSKFLQSLSSQISIKYLTITSYQPQTNGQAKRFNKTIFTQLWHHGSELQRNWDIFVQSLTHVYVTQVHQCTSTSPYSPVMSLQPPGASLLTAGINVPDGSSDDTSPQAMRA